MTQQTTTAESPREAEVSAQQDPQPEQEKRRDATGSSAAEPLLENHESAVSVATLPAATTKASGGSPDKHNKNKQSKAEGKAAAGEVAAADGEK